VDVTRNFLPSPGFLTQIKIRLKKILSKEIPAQPVRRLFLKWLLTSTPESALPSPRDIGLHDHAHQLRQHRQFK
jgi:hypothetical protein